MLQLIFFLLFLITSAAATVPPPPLLHRSTAAAPPPLSHHQQINNIIDALLGAGDFNSWASILSSADPAILPLSATLFIPSDDSRSTLTVDPFIFPYHIVPQRLVFADLCQFNRSSRLPTLLVSRSILITNNSVSNFTLDGSLLSHPDLFTSETIAVHGIENILDYSVYGDSKPNSSLPGTSPPPPPGMFVPSGELISDRPQSGAAGVSTEPLTGFLIFLFLFLL